MKAEGLTKGMALVKAKTAAKERQVNKGWVRRLHSDLGVGITNRKKMRRCCRPSSAGTWYGSRTKKGAVSPKGRRRRKNLQRRTIA